ncbi:Dyp-type peroxidase [Psychrosphaera ytuae]|uniref:Dyp-type peroxidase n=1 Tax=Psychrosphaera ytuae TaxID=2820710 RepID=A0A975HJB9_9GAMM|nr:Dyp-type peroxidase [Psychrosphaera ytuae]QTH65146.1 Dyp-type peroxidase [Psychrosphaera ytuae]
MAREQWGICSEANLHGLHLFFNAHEGYEPAIREALSQLPKLFEQLGDQFSEAMFSGVVAIGANFWSELYPNNKPSGLKPFPAMRHEDRHMPAVPVDLFFQLRSDRQDVNYIASQKLHQLFGEMVELIEQVPCFRYLDGRDLTGFVKGTANAKGRKRREVALVTEPGPFVGGSYLHVQRYRHHLNRWQRTPTEEQELIIGRYIKDNAKLAPEDLPETAHTFRARCFNREGEVIELLRQGMPYGNLNTQGLLFLSYCKEPDSFEKILANMVFGSDAGNYDHLLNYTTAETGAAFFAPSIDYLENQGNLD